MAALRNASKCSSGFQRDSAFSPFRSPDSRDFAKLKLLFLSPNLIFEIDSKNNRKILLIHYSGHPVFLCNFFLKKVLQFI